MLSVAINAAPLAAARTGVGRYISGLLDALAELAPAGLQIEPIFAPTGAVRAARGLARELPFAYALAEAARAVALIKAGPGVYHETNHAAPPFAGPVVLTVHDLSTVLHPQTQDPLRARHFGRALLGRARRATLVITPTQAIAREVVEHLGVEPRRVRAIHHGVDARFTPAPVEREDFVLYVGANDARKGLDTLRAALPVEAKLVCAGPGHGLGYVDEDALVELYRRAAVLVLPSRYEGFGLPLAEAMACGTPCIASDDPALVEVSGGAALHVPRGDIPALRGALERVLNDAGLRAELSARGLERRFPWKTCARAHADVYLEAAA